MTDHTDVKINDIEVKSVLTKSNLPVADYSVNPYTGCAHGCKYCYASFMKRFTHHPEPWGSFVDVKHWPDIKNPKRYAGKELFIGSVTDPYQPLEETACRTRTLLEQMQDSGCTISIATKSDLVLCDLDLIRTFPNARVSWSINTLDEHFREEMDCAVSIERRLSAMKAFHDAGVRTTCFISPIFPGITDLPSIIRRAKDRCNLIWLENLNLRGGKKKRFSITSQKSTRIWCLYMMPSITEKTAATGPIWTKRCGSSAKRKVCSTSATTTPSGVPSTILRLWSTISSTRRSFLPRRKSKTLKRKSETGSMSGFSRKLQ